MDSAGLDDVFDYFAFRVRVALTQPITHPIQQELNVTAMQGRLEYLVDRHGLPPHAAQIRRCLIAGY